MALALPCSAASWYQVLALGCRARRRDPSRRNCRCGTAPAPGPARRSARTTCAAFGHVGLDAAALGIARADLEHRLGVAGLGGFAQRQRTDRPAGLRRRAAGSARRSASWSRRRRRDRVSTAAHRLLDRRSSRGRGHAARRPADGRRPCRLRPAPTPSAGSGRSAAGSRSRARGGDLGQRVRPRSAAEPSRRWRRSPAWRTPAHRRRRCRPARSALRARRRPARRGRRGRRPARHRSKKALPSCRPASAIMIAVAPIRIGLRRFFRMSARRSALTGR